MTIYNKATKETGTVVDFLDRKHFVVTVRTATGTKTAKWLRSDCVSVMPA